VGEGTDEAGRGRDPRRQEGRVHTAIKLLAVGRPVLHGIWRTGPARVSANAKEGLDPVARGQSIAADSYGRAALAQSEAVVVRRVGWPYEGDTLVVDTIGLNARTVVDVYRTPHTKKLHVVERWRLVNGNQGMEVVFTVDDPEAFYEPWSGMRRYRRVVQTGYERICAEGNSHLFNFRMPTAEKPDF
jgi:hypothetical protein